jgi:hypothetical protein
MKEIDLQQLILTFSDKIELYWKWYLTVYLAVIGWLVSGKFPLDMNFRSTVAFAIFMFSVFNLIALSNAMKLYSSCKKDLLSSNLIEDVPNVAQTLKNIDTNRLIKFSSIVYIGTLIVLIFLILFLNK